MLNPFYEQKYIGLYRMINLYNDAKEKYKRIVDNWSDKYKTSESSLAAYVVDDVEALIDLPSFETYGSAIDLKNNDVTIGSRVYDRVIVTLDGKISFGDADSEDVFKVFGLFNSILYRMQDDFLYILYRGELTDTVVRIHMNMPFSGKLIQSSMYRTALIPESTRVGGMDLSYTIEDNNVTGGCTMSMDGKMAAFAKDLSDSEVHVRCVKRGPTGLWGGIVFDEIITTDGSRAPYAKVVLSDDGYTLAIARLQSGLLIASVYTSVDDGVTWSQLGSDFEMVHTEGDVDPDTSIHRIPFTIAMSGDGTSIALGDHIANSGQGLVKVFQFSSITGWSSENEYGENTGNLFGYDISLNQDGSKMVVGAIYVTSDQNRQGASYYYKKIYVDVLGVSVLTLVQDTDMTQYGPSEIDLLGNDVAISDDGKTVAVGAYNYNDDDENTNGLVRVSRIDEASGAPEQIGQDIIGDALSRLGSCLSLSGDGKTLAIGSRDVSVGIIYIYKLVSDQWVKFDEINTEKYHQNLVISDDGRTLFAENSSGDASIYHLRGLLFSTQEQEYSVDEIVVDKEYGFDREIIVN